MPTLQPGRQAATRTRAAKVPWRACLMRDETTLDAAELRARVDGIHAQAHGSGLRSAGVHQRLAGFEECSGHIGLHRCRRSAPRNVLSDAKAARRVCNLVGLGLGLDRKDEHAAAISGWAFQGGLVERGESSESISVGLAERPAGGNPAHRDRGSVGCFEVLDAG